MSDSQTNILDDPELIQDFVAESTELLEKLDEDLVLLESSPADTEILNRIFRAIHTIKGTSAFLGYEDLVKIAHSSEEVLNKLRKGEARVTVPVLNTLLDAIDLIKLQVDKLNDPAIEIPPCDDVIRKLEFLMRNDTDEDGAAIAKLSEEAPEEEEEVVKGKDRKTNVGQTLRIRMRHIDNLINLVGELVIERNRLVQLYRGSDNCNEALHESIERLSFIISELQMAVLQVRMLPIAGLFRKFPRVVRDLAHELGKDVQLHISGEDAELDKSMVDELKDPLVHLLRNAVYHGIEPADERKQKGKSPAGNLYLSASQESNNLIIRIKDDGRGLQMERIAKRAVEKGMISADRVREMKEHEIVHLIFQPGFSTAETANEISGRGVGLDVVHNQIKKLNGIIEVRSEPGKGCEFILKLPLTMAIIQALLVESAGDIYAVPLSSVIEILKIERDRIHRIGDGKTILHRGNILHLVQLSELFNLGGNGHDTRESYVLVIGVAEKRYGLMVDRLHGQEEVVIKPLAEGMPSIAGLAGSMITGDGRVHFILEPSQLI